MKIEITNLVVRYGRTTALDGVTLTVPEGSVFALLGRNGAGKSTLLRVLLGLRRPDRGEIRIDGLDPWHERPTLLRRLAFTPETPDAPAEMTVDAIGRFAARFHPRWDRDRFVERVTRFQISGNRRFGQLSRGQKGLVQLALALSQKPDLLVLDDPTLGLDPVARRFVFDEVIDELAGRGTTILVATHDLEAVERLATHVAILHGGRCLRSGEIDELRRGTGDDLQPLTVEDLFVRETGVASEAVA